MGATYIIFFPAMMSCIFFPSHKCIPCTRRWRGLPLAASCSQCTRRASASRDVRRQPLKSVSHLDDITHSIASFGQSITDSINPEEESPYRRTAALTRSSQYSRLHHVRLRRRHTLGPPPSPRAQSITDSTTTEGEPPYRRTPALTPSSQYSRLRQARRRRRHTLGSPPSPPQELLQLSTRKVLGKIASRPAAGPAAAEGGIMGGCGGRSGCIRIQPTCTRSLNAFGSVSRRLWLLASVPLLPRTTADEKIF